MWKNRIGGLNDNKISVFNRKNIKKTNKLIEKWRIVSYFLKNFLLEY